MIRADIRIRFFHLGGPDLWSKRYALRMLSWRCLIGHCLKIIVAVQESGVFVARLTFVRNSRYSLRSPDITMTRN